MMDSNNVKLYCILSLSVYRCTVLIPTRNYSVHRTSIYREVPRAVAGTSSFLNGYKGNIMLYKCIFYLRCVRRSNQAGCAGQT